MKTKTLTKFATVAILVAGMLTTACRNEDTVGDFTPENENITKTNVVELLKEIYIDDALAQEVHSYVTNALASGHDEEIRFTKILSDQTRNNGQSIMAERLKQLVTEHVATRNNNDGFDTDMLKTLANSDFIIYWPYSDDWDGCEMPTLVAAPENEDAEEAYGIKIVQEGDVISYEKVLVNEEYTMQHPVWVVNKKKEETGVVYAPTSYMDDYGPVRQSVKRSAGNPLYVWKMTGMRVTSHHDGVFYGGDEYDIQVVYPKLPGYAEITAKFRVEFSRKEIRKGRWKFPNILLNTNWREEQVTNALIILESDDGNPITIGATVTAKLDDGTQVGTTTSITITDDDDIICVQPIDRDYALQNEGYYFDGGSVIVAAPIIVE